MAHKNVQFEVTIDRWRFKVLNGGIGSNYVAIYVFDLASGIDDLYGHKFSFFVPGEWANTRIFQFIDNVRQLI